MTATHKRTRKTYLFKMFDYPQEDELYYDAKQDRVTVARSTIKNRKHIILERKDATQ